MRRYIVLYLAEKNVAERFAQATPEEAAIGFKQWMDWSNKIGAGLVDMGKPLGNAMEITKDGVSKSDSKVIGMSILQADSMDEALEMVKGHHHLQWGTITLLEEMPIPELQ
ncbi:MAG TPA: hypothetical protein VLH86_06545 [Patescibacteria group bacterium]|nr:hypothetical protein [Patescibacteria group bacterium]